MLSRAARPVARLRSAAAQLEQLQPAGVQQAQQTNRSINAAESASGNPGNYAGQTAPSSMASVFYPAAQQPTGFWVVPTYAPVGMQNYAMQPQMGMVTAMQQQFARLPQPSKQRQQQQQQRSLVPCDVPAGMVFQTSPMASHQDVVGLAANAPAGYQPMPMIPVPMPVTPDAYGMMYDSSSMMYGYSAMEPASAADSGSTFAGSEDGSASRMSSDDLDSVPASAGSLYSMLQAAFGRSQRPSLTYLHELLQSCADQRDLTLAFTALDRYRNAQIETSDETATLLVKACCRAGVPEQALDAVRNHKTLHLWPTRKAIHFLMVSFAVARNVQGVFDVYDVLRSSGFAPTPHTFHVLIRCCVDAGDIDRALDVLALCDKSKVALKRGTFNVLMNGCRVSGRPDDLLAVYEAMEQHKVACNDSSFKLLLDAHLQKQNLAAAVSAFQQLCDSAEVIPEDSVASLLQALDGDADQQASIRALLQKQASAGKSVAPSVLAL